MSTCDTVLGAGREHEGRPCAGCGTALPLKDPARRSWCERCAHIKDDLLAIERAAGLLRACELAVAADAVSAALETIRTGLGAGDVPAVLVARSSERHGRRREREEEHAAVSEAVRRVVDAKLEPAPSAAPGVLIPFSTARPCVTAS